ncbi:leucine-rich repeat extensin-like protein 3 [Iris pallida]|uniref:Leucine-rich repeat extensin-like protein 3 n=1 Tax=Iris pallida TaxID=29817 RepID=A0AAX6HSB2_IRIPA|nr:leucine-rich repeat extensin-like protein 3 [Iris pallida]
MRSSSRLLLFVVMSIWFGRAASEDDSSIKCTCSPCGNPCSNPSPPPPVPELPSPPPPPPSPPPRWCFRHRPTTGEPFAAVLPATPFRIYSTCPTNQSLAAVTYVA